MFWNIIDADASLSAATKFSVPILCQGCVVGSIHKRKLEKTEVPTNRSSNLLSLQTGARTPFHQALSRISVIYFLC